MLNDHEVQHPQVSKTGAVGLSSDRCSAAGGSGGSGLSDEEDSSEEDDEEDCLDGLAPICFLLSPMKCGFPTREIGEKRAGTGQVRALVLPIMRVYSFLVLIHT